MPVTNLNSLAVSSINEANPSNHLQQSTVENKTFEATFQEDRFSIYSNFNDKTADTESEFDLDKFIEDTKERQVNVPLFERAPIKVYQDRKDDFPFSVRIQSILSKKCHVCLYPLCNYGIFSNKFSLKSSSLMTEYAPQFKIMRVKHRETGYELKLKAINMTRWRMDMVIKPLAIEGYSQIEL